MRRNLLSLKYLINQSKTMETKKGLSLFKNSVLIVIIIFSISQTVLAQSFSGSNRNISYSILVQDNNKAFNLAIRSKKESKYLIDKDIKLPEIDGKKVELEYAICLNDTFLLFTSLLNKNDETYTAYVYKLFIDGTMSRVPTKIDEITNSTKKNTGYFTFEMSADSSTILVYHAHDESIQGEMKGKIVYKILDKNLKVLSVNEIDMPTSFDYCSALKRQLVGNQNLLYLEKNYTKVKGEKGYIIKYNLCLYNSKEQKLYKAAIMADEKYILDVTIEMSSNDQLFCSGIYCIDRSFGGSWDGIRCLKGVFYYLFDKNNLEVISHNEKDIQAALANDKLYRFHMTSSSVSNEKVNITCQFQHQILTSGVGHDNTYQNIFGQYIYTVFDLKDKANTSLNVSEK